MKIFLLFDKASETAKIHAGEVETHLKKGGYETVYGDGANEKQDLTDARFLIFIADAAADFSSTAITSKWRFFLNELRWKRKAAGDIILVCSDECDLSRIPFTLRDCDILRQSEVGGLNKLILSFAGGNSPKDYSYDSRIRNGSLKAESPVDSLSSRNSTVPHSNATSVAENPGAASNGADREKQYADNGCKKDHVFERRDFKHSGGFSHKTQAKQTENEHKHTDESNASAQRSSSSDNAVTDLVNVLSIGIRQKNNSATQRSGAINRPTGSATNDPGVVNKPSGSAAQRSGAINRPTGSAAQQPTADSSIKRPAPVSSQRPANGSSTQSPSRPDANTNPPPAPRPSIYTPQSKPTYTYNKDADDDYDPFAPPQTPPPKQINSKTVAGCAVAGFFAFFLFMIVMIMSNL